MHYFGYQNPTFLRKDLYIKSPQIEQMLIKVNNAVIGLRNIGLLLLGRILMKMKGQIK